MLKGAPWLFVSLGGDVCVCVCVVIVCVSECVCYDVLLVCVCVNEEEVEMARPSHSCTPTAITTHILDIHPL